MNLQDELRSYVRFDRRVKMAGKARLRTTTVGVVPTRMLTDAAHGLDERDRLQIEVANRAHFEEQYRQEIERLRDNEARVLQSLADTDKNCRERFAEYRAEIERLRQVARKLFIELEGDDQFFDGWLANQGKNDE